MTEVTAMQGKSNELHVRVSYAIDLPEWWRIQIRRHLGKQGLATREECVWWLMCHGTGMDDTLRQEFDDWQRAAEEGEEVEVEWSARSGDGETL